MKEDKKEELNFEDAMKRLESIANELEKGELSLDESVKKFEEGMNLSKNCSKILEDSERKISILLKENDKIVEKNFTEEG